MSLNPTNGISVDVDKVKVCEAVGSIRNELQKWLNRRSKVGSSQVFIGVLVEEHLLLPERDFVESLLEDDEVEERLLANIRESMKLPRNLMKSWSDLLRLLGESDQLHLLVAALHEFCSGAKQDSFSRDLANAWISEIFRSLLNRVSSTDRKNKQKQKFSGTTEQKQISDHLKLSFVEFKSSGHWQSLFSHILFSPNEQTPALLPLLSKMLEQPMNPSQEKKVLDLMEVLLGRKVGQASKQVLIFLFLKITQLRFPFIG